MVAPPQHKVRLCAAGSLRAALTEIGKLFAAAAGHGVEAKFGPSGLLKDAIARGCGADLFASADMEHPRALNRSNRSGPVFRFARNSLCGLVRPGFDVDSANLVERMLDPRTKLGTSTPNSDPSGDYALAVFRKLDAVKPGAAILEQKALKLTGVVGIVVPPAGRVAYGWHIAEGGALSYGRSRSAKAISPPAHRGAAARARGWSRARPDGHRRCIARCAAISRLRSVIHRPGRLDQLWF